MRPFHVLPILLAPFAAYSQGTSHPVTAPTFIPDTMVSGISLCDTTSVSVIGHIPYDELIRLDSIDLPRVHFLNADGKEVLTLYFHPGGFVDEYGAISISQSTKEPVRATLPIPHFVSGRGVYLGMPMQDVVQLFGHSATQRIGYNGRISLVYRIEDEARSPFLHHRGYPGYWASFTFENDRLVNYRFGFEYP